MNISLLSGILALLIGLIYTVMTFLLPEASIGRPMEPKIFPMALGMLMIILSSILLVQETKKSRKSEQPAGKFTIDSNLKNIGLTCLFSILYAILFDKLGYVISTILFLEGELFLFNGAKKWKINSIVAVVFSLFIYILFSKLLGVYLPMTPGIWI
ncbi:tripartite tricarboxylate transporter TctB family protein [Spirochaeta isovalerica]|uniref:Putative tricarboxylic transport membrane protein n=1 Tax=Spirochaeta isovalerica TaxID=150 RepID=A0A841RB23_9SPIO|nr:tripartite tricarboxylate transporter TctB family protein [Spirochaeta isovalerica]MBB6480210.1 putative tricarboxylic transport membrane protein [Spirochaeta isovalerica]